MVRNIILDMGNVLMNYDPWVCLRTFVESPEDQELIKKELFQGAEWAMGDLGTLKNAQRYQGVSLRVPPRLHRALRSCVDHWMMCMEPLPHARDFCDAMKKRGFRLYVLSNADDTFYDYFPRFAPLSYFDGIVVSSDVHMVKPKPEIYRYLLKKYGLKPEECFFIDDRADNVEGARSVGMQAAQFLGDYEKFQEMYKTILGGR